jgi:3',5'-nucleoside bisphosphate phosphatase
MRIDLHTHSLVSDGTDTPAELVRKAREVGLDIVALTDHDTFDGLDEAAAEGERLGILLVRGMELSCSRRGDSVHVLAYGADPASPTLAAELARVRDGRLGRLAGVLAKLADLGVPVSEADVMAQVGDSPSVGRPHIADALIKAGHVRDRQEAFDRFLADGGPAHVHRYTIEVDRGIDLVHEAGGLAVIAHPWGRGREYVLPSNVLEALVRDHGLDGIEVDHQDHDAETRQRLRTLADGLGLLATGASDYHGIGKLDHDLGCNTTDPAVFNEMQRRLESR